MESTTIQQSVATNAKGANIKTMQDDAYLTQSTCAGTPVEISSSQDNNFCIDYFAIT